MKCEYCGRDGCLAYATENGFPVLAGDDRTIAEIECRNATRDRALRAEAEVRALCDDERELDPWLPEGWRSVIQYGDPVWFFRRQPLYAEVDRRGNWRVGERNVAILAEGWTGDGILAAIEAAEQGLRSKPNATPTAGCDCPDIELDDGTTEGRCSGRCDYYRSKP